MQRCYGCMKEYGKEYDVCPYCGYIVGTKPESKSHLQFGTKLADRYTVGKALGWGGFGITYIAWDDKLQKAVAVKEYFPNAFSTRSEGDTQLSCLNADAERFFTAGVKKMLDEARRLSSFSKNENIVDIYNFFEENNTAYIVMEYLEGKNLKQYLEENGDKLAPERAVELILPVLNALEDMHKEHLIHRDISPDNIYLCNDGKVKLLDFGSARLASEDSEKSLSVMLKRGFAPKEQYSSRSKQGAWTDVYAVCATLYKMITGETPVESTDRDDEELKSFSELGINGCDELEKIILKGMAIKPADRIQSVQELGAQLTAVNKTATKTEPEKQEISQQEKAKKPVNKKIIVVAAVVVIVAIAAVFGVKYFKDKTETVGQIASTDTTTEVTTLVPMQVIPDVIGYEYAKAEKTLKDLGFEVVKETVENDDASKTGTIKEIKDIKAGEQYPEGATVTLLECGEPAWKKAYADIVKAASGYYVAFELGYVDDDAVPELFVSLGTSHAEGVTVYTYSNGKVVKLCEDGSDGMMQYIERKGYLCGYYCGMGGVSTNVYELKNGKVTTKFSTLDERALDDLMLKGKEREYSINGKAVSQEDLDDFYVEYFGGDIWWNEDEKTNSTDIKTVPTIEATDENIKKHITDFKG